MQKITALWNRGWIGKLAIGLGALVLACCVLGLLARRTPAPNQTASAPTAVAQQIAAAQPTSAPKSTDVPRPTAVPKPTNTPKPTATPKPTEPPTAIPSPTPLPEPVTLSGTGKVVTDKFTPPSGVNRVTFDYQGQSNFIVHVFATNGDEDFLVNTIGDYHGQVLLFTSDPVYFEVNADGPWTAVIEPVFRTDTPVDQFAGHGDTVSDAFDPAQSGPVPYVLSHNGKSNFIVHLYCVGGIDSVANEIGAFDGQVVVRFSDGPCIWEIKADGDWSVKPK